MFASAVAGELIYAVIFLRVVAENESNGDNSGDDWDREENF